MARRKKKSLPTTPVRLTIDSLNHEGRGVGRVDGKTVFVAGALPGEEVEFVYSEIHRNFDEGYAVTILTASPQRVEPRCPHFDVCGGCAMQHLASDAQIAYKQNVLLDDFKHIGKVQPEEVLEPLLGPHWGYRRKARPGVKYVARKGKVLVGFRERIGGFVADLSRCEVLHPSVGERIAALSEMIASLSVYDKIAQIEVAVDDKQTALALRNLSEVSGDDEAQVKAVAIRNSIQH